MANLLHRWAGLGLLLFALLILPLALVIISTQPANAATFTVSNSNDSVAGSLRQAILNSNGKPRTDIIDFGIGSGCVQTISVAALPIITEAVTIDATTQTGCSSRPPIELSGTGAGNGAKGFWLSSSGVTIKGFIINRFSAYGIWIDQGGATIKGNWIGLASDGNTAAENGDDGIGIYSGLTSFSSKQFCHWRHYSCRQKRCSRKR